MQCLKKLNISVLSRIPLLGIYMKQMRAGTVTDVRTPMFITALFTIAKKWQQPKRPQWADGETKYDT